MRLYWSGKAFLFCSGEYWCRVFFFFIWVRYWVCITVGSLIQLGFFIFFLFGFLFCSSGFSYSDTFSFGGFGSFGCLLFLLSFICGFLL